MAHIRHLRHLQVLVLLACSAPSAIAQTLSPATLDLGNWVVGASNHAPVVLTNTLTTPLTISSIAASGDFTQTSTCPVSPKTLGAGVACQITVTFTPTALGARTGTLTVVDNSSSSPQTVALSGNGENPAAAIPAMEAFGDEMVNNTSAAKVFTFQNYQTAPVTITSISTTGNFAQTSTCPLSPSTLAARLSCKISVTFTPKSVGALTGTLSVSDNVKNSPQTSSLKGTGVAAVSLSPEALAFGGQIVNTTSQPKIVTLTNNQTVALRIYGIYTSGDFSRQSTTCPSLRQSLPAGGSCTISITFAPATQGIRTGTLTITTTASNQPQTVGLSGNGTFTPIQHVVIIFQENRTPDNLFHDPVLITRGADIASTGLNSKGKTITLKPAPLASTWDLGHNHAPFVLEYDNGKMDGADKVPVLCDIPPCPTPPANPQFSYVQASDVGPYFALAEQYVFADRMFQTHQGPSFPAHQFIIGATSAPTATSDLFVSGNPMGGTKPGADTGCTAPAGQFVQLIDPEGNENQTQYPCFEHPVLTDLLDKAGLTWRYYTTSGGLLWTGPNAIQHLRLGPDWANVVTPNSTVLKDIKAGTLPAVSWVIPTGQASDHAGTTQGEGPSWIASVVNAVGNSQYWNNTAIIITWDDWGGWYDHVAPKVINSYEYGFRVPMIVVSPYAKPQYISHVTHDFGSILKFVENTYNLPSLGYADALADDLSDCFNFSQTPIKFKTIQAPLGADFFLNDTRIPTDPDDDLD